MNSFPSLLPALGEVATRALRFCTTQYGQRGLHIDEGIHNSISWRPTFYIRPRKFELLAAEVSDIIFPDVLKGAAQDIRHYDQMIRVFQVSPLDVFLADREQKKVTALRMQGFGLITVAQDGTVTKQYDCVPLIQFISESEIEDTLRGLPTAMKVRLRSAYQTYLTNPRQGVQDAGQVTEGLIISMAKQSAKLAGISNSDLKKPLADLIDLMYSKNCFSTARAALGASRGFVRLHRNPASHPPKSTADAARQVREARDGFLTASKNASLIAEAIKAMKLKVTIYD